MIYDLLDMPIMKITYKNNQIEIHNKYEIFTKIFPNFIEFKYNFEIPSKEEENTYNLFDTYITTIENKNYVKVNCLVPSLLYDGVNIYRLVVYIEKIFATEKGLKVLSRRLKRTSMNIYRLRRFFEHMSKVYRCMYGYEVKTLVEYLTEDKNIEEVVNIYEDLDINSKFTVNKFKVSINDFNFILYLALDELSNKTDESKIVEKIKNIKKAYYEKHNLVPVEEI